MKHEISSTDWLALERTKLANERTFLAYFRTFVVVFGSGLTIVKVDLLKQMEELGFCFYWASHSYATDWCYSVFCCQKANQETL